MEVDIVDTVLPFQLEQYIFLLFSSISSFYNYSTVDLTDDEKVKDLLKYPKPQAHCLEDQLDSGFSEETIGILAVS